RDFFDLDHGVRLGRFSPGDRDLIETVRQKLAVPGNEIVDMSGEKLQTLRRQVDSELAPVLRAQDIATFDIDRAFAVAAQVAARLQTPDRD
ncbi:MAG TPA: hypothetical protein DD670_09315, partial [Planctomycetaceae bacterium]|nr:hypothetical protein [Planctomycetaceae bacterium]